MPAEKDAKREALRQQGTLNPRPDEVTDELFAARSFFDPRDLVQVKYEMGQTGPIGKNTTLSSRSLVALDGIWAERSEPAPRALSSLPVIGAGKGDVLPA